MVENLQVGNDGEVPEVRFTLSQELSRAHDLHFEDFLRNSPDTDITARACGCGLEHSELSLDNGSIRCGAKITAKLAELAEVNYPDQLLALRGWWYGPTLWA